MTNNEAIRIINGWKEADIKEKQRQIAYLGEERAKGIAEMLDKQIEACDMAISALKATTLDPSHPFADDVMMGDKPPIKYCKICTHFNQHAVYDSSTGNVKASDYGTCYLDQHVHTVDEKACPGFCYHANA